MENEILTIVIELLNTLTSANINQKEHHKLYKLINKLFNNIEHYNSSRIYDILNEIIIYISYNKELIKDKNISNLSLKILKQIKKSFPLNNEEEIIEIALENYVNGYLTIEEYLESLIPKETLAFDGKLTEEELTRLKKAGFKASQIEIIKQFVMEKRDYLNGFHDLVGDNQIPTKLFTFNITHTGYKLTDDLERAITKRGADIRTKITSPLIKALSRKFMFSDQIFENRNALVKYDKDKNIKEDDIEEDKGIILPDEPVLWTLNHHFKDDALATIRAAKRPFYFLFGSIPLYFNTLDGILAYLVGSILINRVNQKSKTDSFFKAERAIETGLDLFWSFEAVHNKSSNKLVLDAWNGIYRFSNEKGIKVVPIIHYIKDPTQRLIPNKLNPIHTVIDDPIDLTKFSEKAGLDYLREVISTWYYLMMEKYGKMTREELFNEYQKRAIHYGINPKDFDTHPLTSAEIGTLYNMDLRSTISSYDTQAETQSDFTNENIISPEEAFKLIANIQNPKFVEDRLYAQEIIRTRKYENYQKRF